MHRRYLVLIIMVFLYIMLLQGCGDVKILSIEIEGIRCLIIDDKNVNRIHEQVMGGILAEPVTIRGIKFAPQKHVSRYSSGKLQSGYLAEKTYINGYYFAAKSNVRFFENGFVQTGTLTGTTKIGDIKYKADSEIELNEQGKVVSGVLDEDTPITDYTRASIPLYYAGGHRISFQAGRVTAGTLAHRLFAWGIGLPRFTEVMFYPSGCLANIRNENTKESFEKYGVKYKFDSGVSFYESGRVRSGTVAENTVIDGKTISRGTVITLDEIGHLKKVN